MGRSDSRKRFRSSLKLEALEQRQLFATDMFFAFDGSSADQYQVQQVSKYIAPTDKLTTIADESGLDTKLKELVGKYWEGVLGKKSEEIYPPGPVSMTLEDVGFGIGARAQSSPMFLNSAIVARSITNTRHDNIDETDSVDMTSDGFLYSVSGGALHVTDLRDPSQIETKDFAQVPASGAGLIVTGDSLIVLESVSVYGKGIYTFSTRLTVYDIADRMNPALAETSTIDGMNVAAFLTNGQLTLVQNAQGALPTPGLVKGSDGAERYESLDSYYATNRNQIISALLPDYVQDVSGEQSAVRLDLGNWQDLSFANDAINERSSVLRFSVADHALNLIDSETIVGLHTRMVYQGQEDIYLVSDPTQYDWQTSDWEMETFIYKIDVNATGELRNKGVATILGTVNDTTWLNEHAGVLQVASLGNKLGLAGGPRRAMWGWGVETSIFPPTFEPSANITTVGDEDGSWRVLGTLNDIASGQSLLAANFFGDRAVVTTGSLERMFYGDPLHGIDLSDPTDPREMSELTIPGFTSYLKQLDETHWLGVGFDQDPVLSSSHLQVSLYKVADLANPVVIDSWVSSDVSWFGNFNAKSVSLDAATGLLTITSNIYQADGSYVAQPILKVDLTADDPLRFLDAVKLGSIGVRGFMLDNIYVGVTDRDIATFTLTDSVTALDKVETVNYLSLESHYWMVPIGGTMNFKLADFWTGSPFEITSLETSGPIQATLNPDQSITLTSSGSDYLPAQALNLTLRFSSGLTRSLTVYTYSQMALPNPQDARGSLVGRFTDDAGKTITSLAEGDEVWVTISAVDGRVFGSGVFSAYADVSFDSQNVKVLGDIEHLGEYQNGQAGTISEGGIKDLGGFGSSSPPGQAPSDIARFKIRVENNLPVTMTITPSTSFGNEFLLYGYGSAVERSNIGTSVLTTQLSTRLLMDDQQQDVNADGAVTALDVLQIVNYINSRDVAAEPEAVAALSVAPNYDLTGDGVVSALDVLQIVNTLNARYNAPASGEGEQAGRPSAWAVDQVLADSLMAIDPDSFAKRILWSAEA